MNKESIFSLPNIFSLMRLLIFAPAITLCIVYRNEVFWGWSTNLWFIIFVSLAIISDFLDGGLAVLFDMISETGKILDSVADKTTIIAASTAMYAAGIIPVFFFIILVLRDVLILAGSAILKFNGFTNGKIMPATWLGKITTNVIAITLLLHFYNVKDWLNFSILVTLFFILASFIEYYKIFISLIKKNLFV